MDMERTIGVAILGFGVVGSGVARVLTENREKIAESLHAELKLKYILNRRDLTGTPYGDRQVHDLDPILADPEVKVLVETIGGVGAALEYTRRALEAGKSVVTSNKELVAEHGCELMAMARDKGVSYLYEGAVAGGIPILHPLKNCLRANEISEVRGILNGTTNYILTRMFRDRLPFEAALAEAQEKGYAETDPTADVEGLDAGRKICILASLAFGQQVSPSQVPCEGITGVTAADVDYAASRGWSIKLLGRAVKGPEGKVRAYVAPHLLRREDPLACAEDVFNAVTVRGNAVGDVMFYGRGAGSLPTASAVVSDIMEAVREEGLPKSLDWAPDGPFGAVSPADVSSRWYLRFNAGPGELPKALGDVEYLARQGGEPGESAFLTAPMTLPELEERLGGMVPASRFRVLED